MGWGKVGKGTIIGGEGEGNRIDMKIFKKIDGLKVYFQ